MIPISGGQSQLYYLGFLGLLALFLIPAIIAVVYYWDSIKEALSGSPTPSYYPGETVPQSRRMGTLPPPPPPTPAMYFVAP